VAIELGNAVTAFLPLIALALTLALILPQLRRIAIRHDASGTSIAGLASAIVSFGAWLVYFAHLGEWSAVIAMAGGGAAHLITAWLAWKYGGDRRSIAVPVILASVLVGAYLLGGWRALAVVLVTTVLWSYVPAVFSAWTSPRVAGLSPGTWLLALSYGAVWLWFGINRAELAVVVNGSLNVLLSFGVLLAIIVRNPGSDRETNESSQAMAG
jgi:uncharacterized protein with PQ loop repeat